jgi:hypothetical protein
MAPQIQNLVCKDCGYANETQRVYCHNCGSKLDRDILDSKEQEPDPSPKRLRQVQKLMSPERGKFTKACKKLIKTVFLAAVLAALIDAVLPPEGVAPPTKAEDTTESPQLDAILENLATAPAGKRVVLHEAEINAYMKRERFKKLPSWLTENIPMRMFVRFHAGTGDLTLQASVLGYPLYASLSGYLQIHKDAQLVATCTGGNIGRLQIPAELARYGGLALPTLLDALKQERQGLDKLGSIEIRKEQILLSARGASTTPAATLAPNGAAVH